MMGPSVIAQMHVFTVIAQMAAAGKVAAFTWSSTNGLRQASQTAMQLPGCLNVVRLQLYMNVPVHACTVLRGA
jgi:hypothetical protein